MPRSGGWGGGKSPSPHFKTDEAGWRAVEAGWRAGEDGRLAVEDGRLSCMAI
ncbi:MAG: hypothetical protein HY890_05615 [Deltaproteobacteria bacterium]|nr:hypothetical protein [Deltaproteobacteria bacterium]